MKPKIEFVSCVQKGHHYVDVGNAAKGYPLVLESVVVPEIFSWGYSHGVWHRRRLFYFSLGADYHVSDVAIPCQQPTVVVVVLKSTQFKFNKNGSLKG